MRDPVHGHVELDELAVSLMDTPRMQRLRRIRQLGLSNLVYPGANHTRFEHSLGAHHLATTLAGEIDSVQQSEIDELRVAAMLHDIGHGPLSHVTEGIIKKYTRREHEDVKHLLRKGDIAEVCSEAGLNISRIANHILGKTSLGQIINSEIDVDRMDYLIRDAHYTGVAYGLVDHSRLIHKMQFYEDKLVVTEGGLNAAESLLVSRFLMHPSVYFHHVTRISETMLIRGIEYLVEREKLDPSSLQDMDDYRLFETMRHDDGYAGEMINRIDERKLYKRALYVGFDDVDEKVLDYRKSIQRVEKEIAEEAGIDEEEILIDIPKLPRIEEMKALVKVNGKKMTLDKASHIVATLEKAHRDNWKLGVYTPREHREKVNKIVNDFFEVKKQTLQYKLTDISGDISGNN